MPAPITLPFSKSASFPSSAFDPNPAPIGLPGAPRLPDRYRQGVETRAKLDAPKPRPGAPNTSVSDRVAALGMRPGGPASPTQPPAGPAPQPGSSSPSGYVPRTLPPRSILGGVDSRPLSQRGGPMEYSGRGVGTTNPNAYRVGQPRMPGERMLMRAARRGDVKAASYLYGSGQQAASEMRSQAFQAFRDQQLDQRRQEERQQDRGWQREDTEGQRAYESWREDQRQQQRADERGQERRWQIKDRRQEWNRQDAQEAKPDTIEEKPINGGKQIGIFRNGKLFNVVGGDKQEPGMTADDIAAAQAQGGTVSIQQGNTQVQLPGKLPKEPKLPDGIQYEKDINGNITGAVYPSFNQQTGQWGLSRLDLNGDGVVSAAEKSASKTGRPTAAAPKGGSGFLGKL